MICGFEEGGLDSVGEVGEVDAEGGWAGWCKRV